MNDVLTAGAATPPMPVGRIAASGLGRVALAGVVLVLAAVVVSMSGSAVLGGRIGAVFGLHAAESTPVHVVRLAPPESAKPAVTVGQGAPAGPVRVDSRRHVQARRRASAKPRQIPAATPAPRPAPVTAPAPPSPPPPVEIPRPAPAGTVQRAVDTVNQAARATITPVVPAMQPVLDQAAATVGQVCGVLGGCP